MSKTFPILITAATPFEIIQVEQWLQQQTTSTNKDKKNSSDETTDDFYVVNGIPVAICIHGVGGVLCSTHLSMAIIQYKPRLIIQAGIAGAFDRNLKLTQVVQVYSERFLDLGVEEKDGSFTSVFELGIMDETDPIFTNGIINISDGNAGFLPQVKGGTVNKVTGTQKTIDLLKSKYPSVQTESMEGAAAAYVAKSFGVEFIQLRAISNYVESRNRDNWELVDAIAALNNVLIEMVGVLVQPK